MNIKERIRRSKPYLLGVVSGISISVCLVGLNAMKEPKTEYLAPQPFTESSVSQFNFDYMKTGQGPISNRTERYYHRGLDWIMIKDFPEHVNSYEGIFKGVSEVLWSK